MSLTRVVVLAGSGNIPITGAFSFTAITATFTVPAGYNAVFTNSAPVSLNMVFFADAPSDPGQWVTFMDVAITPPPTNNGAIPEPITATLGLMGLGVLGMATRRRVAA